MEKVYKIKACCALCEYIWEKANCPLYTTCEAARKDEGIETFDTDLKYRLVCDEFELKSNWQQAED